MIICDGFWSPHLKSFETMEKIDCGPGRVMTLKEITETDHLMELPIISVSLVVRRK